MNSDDAVLERMYRLIESRKDTDPETSYTARLFTKGSHKIAQKLGEEGVEAAIAAVAEGHDRLVRESADVIYHLLVLWVAKGVAIGEVWTELERRFGAVNAIKELRKKSGDNEKG
jgi:phosphoribosyl-ATP pyrophosphohydrolase